MKKYFTFTSVFFYFVMLMSFITIMVADHSVMVSFVMVLVVDIPLWLSYYRHVEGLSPEEISKRFGFYGNKFFDCSEE